MTRSPWWRRLLRWAIRLLVVAVAVRLLLALFLTQLIAFAAPWLGLQVQIRSAWLSLAGLSLRLQDVVAADAARPTAPPLLRAGEITLDLSARALLRGEFVVDVGAVAQAHAQLERDADGRLLLPSAWTASTPVAVHQPAGASAISSLRLPFQARALRLHDVVVTFVDGAASPPRTDELTIDVAARDLGDPLADANLAVRVHAPDAMDAGWLQATLHGDDRTLRLRWQADLRDVRTARLAAAVALPPALAKLTSLGATATGELRLALAAPGVLDGEGNATVRLLADGQERVVAEASFGPARANTTARTLPFALRLRAPGFVDELAVADAELDQRDDELGCRGRLRADGVTLAAVRPWLAAHGLQWPDAGMRASAAIDVSLGSSLAATLRDLRLQSGDESITAPLVAVRDLRRDDEGLAIEDIELVGPVGAATRRADGGWSALGATFAPTTGPAPAAAPTPAGAPHRLHAIRVGSLRWRGADLTFTDATRSGGAPRMPGADLTLPDATRGGGAALRLADVDVHGDGLAFGVDAPPGRLHLRAMLADAVSSLELDATLAPARDTITAQATLAADGLTLRALQPWLAPLGVAPRWQGAALRLAAEARVSWNDGKTAVAARVGALRLVDGEQTLLQAGDVAVEGLRFGSDGLVLGAWTLNGPDVALARESDGALVVAGVALSTNPRPQPKSPPAEPAAPTTPAAAAIPLPTVALADGVLRWRDGGAPERRIELAATVGAANAAAEVPVRATLRSPGAIANCVVEGTVRPAQPAAKFALAADGISGAGLADLLPPSLRCELRDGAVAGTLAWSAGDGGGFTVEATDVLVRDGADESFALPRARLDVAAADADAAHVRELAVEGLRGAVQRDADGVRIAGFRALAAAGASASPAPGPTAADAAAEAGVRVPRLRVDRAALQIARLTVARPDAAPVDLTATATLAPWDASTADLLATPARWTVEVAAPPLLREAKVELAIAPFALQPTLDAIVRVAGADLTQLAPGGTVADAAVAADLHARANLRRRDPQRFALGRPFGGEFAIEGFALRDGATGAALAQADSVAAAIRAIDPRTGDVLLRTLTATGIALDVTRTADGVQLPGVFVATAKPAARVGNDAAAGPATATADAATTTTTTAAAPEFAIEHLSIQGLRTTFRDDTTAPATVAPIADAEIDLHGLTTRAFAEPRPLAFDVSLRGGDLDLERRVHAGNLLAGVVGSAARAVAMQGNRHALERRPLFDEIALAGRLEFAPFLRGEVRGNVASFELMGLRGLAKQASIEIADGVVDQRVQVDLRGPDGIDVKSLQVFRWLSLTEPPGGPITTYLRLPMPLPSVLFLLRNEAEEQRIPIAIHLPARGVKTSDVVDAVAEAFAKVVADAVAGAARRAAGVVTGFFDFLWPARPLPTATVAFAPGDAAATAAELQAIAEALASDRQLEVALAHELGAGDLPRVRALATPPAAVVQAHVAELRQERAELETRRVALVADLDALYAAGRMPEARRGQEALLAHDARLGALERTLDDALAVLANDTPRAARRREEAAARALGQARLQAVVGALRRAVPGLDPERVVVRPPRATASGEAADGGGVTATLRRRMAR